LVVLQKGFCRLSVSAVKLSVVFHEGILFSFVCLFQVINHQVKSLIAFNLVNNALVKKGTFLLENLHLAIRRVCVIIPDEVSRASSTAKL